MVDFHIDSSTLSTTWTSVLMSIITRNKPG